MRLSQTQRAEDARAVALQARQNLFGVTAEEAARMPETTWLGALSARGRLSDRRYAALAEYREVCRTYDRMMLARPTPSAGDLNRSHGYDGDDGTSDEYRARYNRAKDRFDRCMAALDNCPDKRVRSTVNGLVFTDMPPAEGFHGTLETGADALAVALGLPAERARVTERA